MPDEDCQVVIPHHFKPILEKWLWDRGLNLSFLMKTEGDLPTYTIGIRDIHSKLPLRP